MYPSTPPRRNLKCGPRHKKWAFAWRSGVIICPSKIETWGEPLDPKCRNSDVCGKMGLRNCSGNVLQKREKAFDDRTFLTQRVRCHSPGRNRCHRDSSARGEETSHKRKSKMFDVREKDCNSAVHTHFWAWPKFHIFAHFDPRKTHDSASTSSHRGGFVLGLLSEGTRNCKK